MPHFDVLDIATDLDYATLSIKDVLLSPVLCRQRSLSPGRMFCSEMLQSTISPSFSKSISSTALDSVINAPFSTTPSPPKLGYPDHQSPSSQTSFSFPRVTRLSPLPGLDFDSVYSEFSPLRATSAIQPHHLPRSASKSPHLKLLEPSESPVVRRSLGDVTPPLQTRMSQRRPKLKTKTATTTTTTTTTTTVPAPASVTARKPSLVQPARQATSSPADQRQLTPTLTHSMTSDTPFIDRLRQTTGKLFPASFSPIRRSPSYTQIVPLRSPFASDTHVGYDDSVPADGHECLPSMDGSTPPSKAYLDFYASPLTEPESSSSSWSSPVSTPELPRRRNSARQAEKLGPDATCAAVLKTIKRPLSNDDISAKQKQHPAKKRKQNPIVTKSATRKPNFDSTVIIENAENTEQSHFDIHAFRRTFPPDIPIREEFSAFYRQYPIIPFFYPNGTTTSVLATRTTKRPPSGFTINEPRSAYDLYTPRFTKGVGINKVGLCPICFEPKGRGGNGTIEWFAMKVSAYKYYHLQYVHGISSFTGTPFSPPIAFRVCKRRPAEIRKHEKTELLHGKCHKCDKWVAVEGVKIGEVKVKELYWWKHAASCHKSTTIPGETDIYIQDNVYDKLMEYEKSRTSENQNQNQSS